MSKFDQGAGQNIPVYTVATLPAVQTAADNAIVGTPVIMVSDAATNACLAFSDGTNWLRADTGAVVS